MTKTLLRIEESIDFTAEMKKNLIEEFFPEEFTITNFTLGKFEIKEYYTQRIKSITDAFLFIAQSLPEPIKHNLINAAEKKFIVNSDDFNEANSTLIMCKHHLLDAIVQHIASAEIKHPLIAHFEQIETKGMKWGSISKKKTPTDLAIEILNTAEQYLIMKNGAPNLATLSKCPQSSYLTLQTDNRLPPFIKSSLEELQCIKDNPLPPELLVWFNTLPVEFQDFLMQQPINYAELFLALTMMEGDLRKPLSLEERIKKSAPIIKPLLQNIPEASLNTIFSEIKKKLTVIGNKDLSSFHKLPAWYIKHAKTTTFLHSFFLSAVLNEISPEEIPFIPARNTWLAGASNFAAHKTYLLDERARKLPNQKAIINALPPSWRNTHFASKSIEDKNATFYLERKFDLFNTLVQESVNEGNPIPYTQITFITLISPSRFTPLGNLKHDYKVHRLFSDFLQEKENTLFLQNNRPVPISFTNHPINLMNYILPEHKGCEPMEKILEKLSKNMTPLFQAIFIQYKKYRQLSQAAYLLNAHAPQLCLSVYESLMTLLLQECSLHLDKENQQRALLVITCMSGKDRTGVVELGITAEAIYISLYNQPCDHDNPVERDKLAEIFAHLYLTRHMQGHASQSAPGANGFKYALQYLPADFSKKILELSGNPEYMALDNSIAGLNEVKTMTSKSIDMSPGLVHAVYFTPEQRNALLTCLKQLISGNDAFWAKKKRLNLKFGYGAPENNIPKGIQALRNALNNIDNLAENNPQETHVALSVCINIAVDHLKNYSLKAKTVTNIYIALKNLTTTEKDKQTLFEESMAQLNQLKAPDICRTPSPIPH